MGEQPRLLVVAEEEELLREMEELRSENDYLKVSDLWAGRCLRGRPRVLWLPANPVSWGSLITPYLFCFAPHCSPNLLGSNN